jgi:type I restriction enzyme S subunit
MANIKNDMGKVPNLRLPGFEGEWKEGNLGKLAKISSGGTPSRTTSTHWNGEIPWVTTSLINFNILSEAEEYITEQGLKGSSAKLFPKNTVLMAMYGQGRTRGKVAILGMEAATNQACAAIIPNPSLISYSFLFQNLSKRYDEIRELSNQGGQQNLSGGIIKGIKILYPSFNEQIKIAELLSKIDSRIDTQNKIIEGLKLSKKMLIKKLFNQQLSFDRRHNNNFPDWEEKKMKELFSFKITNSFSREQLNHKSGEVKNIHYGDIHTRFQTLFDIEKEEVPYINSDVNINKINEENYCAIGDMIFADASEDLIDVGKSIEIVNVNNQKLLAGLHTILARPISNTFSIGFCGYLFKSDRIRIKIQKESQGSKILSISAVRLSNISFSIPCIEEQIKITNFLSSIDSKIDIETRFLQKLVEQKKFLLQNLFV